MGAYADKFNLPNNETLTSDDLTMFLEMVCDMFLRLISENDRDKYNYVVMNLDEIARKSREKMLEQNPHLGATTH